MIRLVRSPFIGANAMFHRSFAMIAALLFGAAASAEQPLTLDLLVTNARIWTGEAKQPNAAVIGIFQGRILFISTNLKGSDPNSGPGSLMPLDLSRIAAKRTIDAK